MTAVRRWVPMPDPFTVVWERPRVTYLRTARVSSCEMCGVSMRTEYGEMMPLVSHWCQLSGRRQLIIWEAF